MALPLPGDEAGERSSLGSKFDRRRGRGEGEFAGAAVEKIEQAKREDFFGHRKRPEGITRRSQVQVRRQAARPEAARK